MNEQILEIHLNQITSHPDNRRVGGFDQGKLEQLAESIRTVGVQQPAIVRQAGEDGRYEIVAGERRFRAARIAGLDGAIEQEAILVLRRQQALQHTAVVEHVAVHNHNLAASEQRRAQAPKRRHAASGKIGIFDGVNAPPAFEASQLATHAPGLEANSDGHRRDTELSQ